MKTPPITIAVTGIDASCASPPERIDWAKLCAHPPFQMFVRERLEADAREMAAMYLRSQEDEARTFETYRKWFAAKGYWPGESATGEEESHEQDH